MGFENPGIIISTPEKKENESISLEERLENLKEEGLPINIEKLESMPTIMACLKELRDGDVPEAEIDNHGASHFENAVSISKMLNEALKNDEIKSVIESNGGERVTQERIESMCTAALYHDAGKVFDGENISPAIKDLYNIRDLTPYGKFPVKLKSVVEDLWGKKYDEDAEAKIMEFKNDLPQLFPDRFTHIQASLEQRLNRFPSDDEVINVLWEATLTMRDLYDYHARGSVMALEKDSSPEEDLLSFEISGNHHLLQSKKNGQNYRFFDSPESNEKLLPYVVLFEFLDKIEAGLSRPGRDEKENSVEMEKVWDQKIAEYVVGMSVKYFHEQRFRDGDKIRKIADSFMELFFKNPEHSQEIREMCLEVMNQKK